MSNVIMMCCLLYTSLEEMIRDMKRMKEAIRHDGENS